MESLAAKQRQTDEQQIKRLSSLRQAPLSQLSESPEITFEQRLQDHTQSQGTTGEQNKIEDSIDKIVTLPGS